MPNLSPNQHQLLTDLFLQLEKPIPAPRHSSAFEPTKTALESMVHLLLSSGQHHTLHLLLLIYRFALAFDQTSITTSLTTATIGHSNIFKKFTSVKFNHNLPHNPVLSNLLSHQSPFHDVIDFISYNLQPITKGSLASALERLHQSYQSPDAVFSPMQHACDLQLIKAAQSKCPVNHYYALQLKHAFSPLLLALIPTTTTTTTPPTSAANVSINPWWAFYLLVNQIRYSLHTIIRFRSKRQ